jgi:hypothetical protein
MNWFERHLNWTAVISAAACWLLTLIFPVIILGFSFFPGVPLIIITTVCCYLLLNIIQGWVLWKKNRSHVFLFLYLPALLVTIGIWVSQAIVKYFTDPPAFLPFGLFFITVLHYIGLIVILSLNNRGISANSIVVETSHNVERKLVYYYLLYESRSVPLRLVLSILGVVLFLYISSFIFTNYGYLTYEYNKSDTSTISSFSFKYLSKFHVIDYDFNSPIEFGHEFQVPGMNNLKFRNLELSNSRYFGNSSQITLDIYSPSVFSFD